SSHHRYYARKALKNISVDVSETPILFLDEWTNLYADLTKRFDVRGIRAFSKAAFARQLEIPGAVMFRALYEGTAVAAHVAYIQDKVCYGHLAGVNTLGQKLMASYALYWSEIEYFADKAEWLDWGAGVGIQQNDNDGVAQFKRGWSTGTRVSYFCGKIFDHEKYDQIVNAYDTIATEYFPAYRTGEFS
ncbi:MAG: GNAT family N-acetyltransferase, partial [Desulforhabdus sp.]|nr:GNAT family N-acetyltransferase [Desulforhabdus sp.]